MMMKFKPSHVDVLIVGAGPAGSMLAASLARNRINARIIDKRGTTVICGHADGLNQRTMEIFQAMDLSHDIEHEGLASDSSSVWGPSEKGGIERKGRSDIKDGPKYAVSGHLLHQARIEQLLQSKAAEYWDIEVERGILPVSLTVGEITTKGADAYPVEITVQHLSQDEAAVQQLKSHVKEADDIPHNGLYRSNIGAKDHSEKLFEKVKGRKATEEVIRARHVVGCDGARSWIRSQIGVKMVGTATDVVWGVLDVIPHTDFPDIRSFCIIKSDGGSLSIIPRENGMIRLYIHLSEVKIAEGEVFDRSKITPDNLIRKAQKILQPYKLEYRYCDWWTVYQVGQRVGDAFSDETLRIFLAGDAVHTHSPQEGLGMNTSMQDAFNLGWKLAAVINNESPASILESYQAERMPVAKQLAEVDKSISSGYVNDSNSESLAGLYGMHSEFIEGYDVRYDMSSLTASGIQKREINEEILDGPLKADEVNLNGVNSIGVNTSSRYGPKPLTNGNGTIEGINRLSPHMEEAPNSLPMHLTQTRTDHGNKLCLGARIPPVSLRMQSGHMQRSLLSLMSFNGRWKLFVLPGFVNTPEKLARANAVAEALGDPVTGILHKKHTSRKSRNVPFPYALGTESGRRVQMLEKEVPLIEVFMVHGSDVEEVELNDFHDIYWPLDTMLGRDYDHILYSMDAYEKLEISKEEGALLLVRPDQHLSWKGALGDVKSLRRFLETCVVLGSVVSSSSSESDIPLHEG